MAFRLKSRSLREAGEGSNSLRGERGATKGKITGHVCLTVCACVCGLLQPLMGPAIISFPSLRAGKIVVIYMAQVQPDSNMSDISYYSEIFSPAVFEWRATL